MNRQRNLEQPLPRVASPPFWSWRHFRSRHLAKVVVGLAVPMAIGLMTINLPQLVESVQPLTAAPVTPVTIAISVFTQPVRTNITLGEYLTGPDYHEAFADHD